MGRADHHKETLKIATPLLAPELGIVSFHLIMQVVLFVRDAAVTEHALDHRMSLRRHLQYKDEQVQNFS